MSTNNKTKNILQALHNRYIAEVQAAVADLLVFLDDPVSIPDHLDMVNEVSAKIAEMDAAQSKIQTLESLITEHYPDIFQQQGSANTESLNDTNDPMEPSTNE